MVFGAALVKDDESAAAEGGAQATANESTLRALHQSQDVTMAEPERKQTPPAQNATVTSRNDASVSNSVQSNTLPDLAMSSASTCRVGFRKRT